MPADLTTKVLVEIRDELRATNRRLEAFEVKVMERFEAIDARFEAANARFEVIETTLRDLSEQMLLLTRAVKVSIERREREDQRLDEHDRRLSALEAERRTP